MVKASGMLEDATVWIRRIGIAFAVTAALVLVAKLVYGPVKVVWGRRYAAASEALWKAGKYEDSGQKLRAALQFAPRDTSVLRWAAKYCAQAGLAQGLNYYEMLIGSRQASREDRVAYVELALRLNRVDLGGRELTQLLGVEPESVDLLVLLASQQRIARDMDAAVRTARRALQLSPSSLQLQLLLGSLLLEYRTHPELAPEARRLLMGVVVSHAPESADAAIRLASTRGLARGDVEVLIKYFNEFPPRSMTEHLLAMDLKLMANPSASNRMVSDTVISLLPELKTTNLAAVINWSILRGGAAQLLQGLPGGPSQTNVTVLELRGVALAEMENWNDLDALLESHASKFEPFIVEKLRGQSAMGRGKTAEAQTHFQAAIAANGVQGSQLRAFARELEAMRLPVVAAQANLRAMSLGTRSGDASVVLNAGLEVLRLLAPTDEAQTIRDTLLQLSKALPGDDALAGERAWYDLMFRDRIDYSTGLARRLQKNNPNEVQWRVLLALAELQSNRPEEALQLMEEPPIDWSRARPRWKAVYVGALGAAQRREAARRFASQIPEGSLKSVELQLVTPWR
jgi:tetratricopeptide (TPR) repeat protein